MKFVSGLILVFALFGCQTEIKRVPEPDNLIARDTLVMILQDLVVLEAHVTDKYPQVNLYQDLMRKSGDSVLSRYNVTYKRFDQAMDYYGSRQKEMQLLYSEVQDSLTWKVNHLR